METTFKTSRQCKNSWSLAANILRLEPMLHCLILVREKATPYYRPMGPRGFWSVKAPDYWTLGT